VATMRKTQPPEKYKRGAKAERFQARLSAEQKAQMQRAADYEGQTLSEFVINSAQSRAEEVIREREVLRLSSRDSHAFVEALLNPPEPSERMRALAAQYQVEVWEQ
jgi:uncharacterized protein (DUF1778 family)